MTGRDVALTLWQPWASLIAVGAKTIETRSWSTSYRGPLAIHAATKAPVLGEIGEWTVRFLGPERVMHKTPYPRVTRSLPLGAVVATCTLVDVVPMVGAGGCKDATKHLCIVNESMLLHSRLDEPWPDGSTEHVVSNQRPYGDFAAGRFAWLLDDIQPITPAIAAKGHQGLWEWEGERISGPLPGETEEP